MSIIKQNLKPLQDSLGDAFMINLTELFGDQAALLDQEARRIAALMAIAARRNKMALVDECRDQLMALVVESELRVEESKEGMLDFFFDAGINTLFGVAAGGIKALKVVG